MTLVSDERAHRHREDVIIVRPSVFRQEVEREVQRRQHERSVESRCHFRH